MTEKDYWLGFSAFPGIGPLRFKLLLSYFKSAKRAWQASGKELLEIGLGEKLTAKLVAFRKQFNFEDYLRKLSQKNISYLTLSDKKYPPLLREIPAAPFVIYIRGHISHIAGWENCFSVVGTRKITGYGRTVTQQLTTGLVDAGLTIVSGMAYGVDTAAHETTIACGGKTIAVLGCGVDIIHPPINTKLYWRIVEQYGVVISEFPPGQRADKGTFPSRNRIISGLSKGILVTEGAYDSGALITAGYAADQGREVFAVPGPITSALSAGPTKLLKQGAKLVTEVGDILEELNIKYKISKIKNTNKILNSRLSSQEKRILELLQKEELHFDELVRQSQIEARKLGGILSLMEMKKLIGKSEGGLYAIFP